MSKNNFAQDIADLFYDPLGFVRYVFPWGRGELADEKGPQEWQIKILETLGEELKKQGKGKKDRIAGAIRIAAKSGHGAGKSCLMSWLILFFMTTRPDIQVIATANTESQLKTKLWRELAKWHRRAIPPVRDLFEWTATRLVSRENPEDWYASAIAWNSDNPEAMAGAHDKTVLYLFDEASGIPEIIWETAEGALTDGGGVFMVFGNPTRNTGNFYECFNKASKFWITHTVNCEEVERVDKKLLEQWREIYGADSDFYRVRALGEFPRAATRQFIPLQLVEEATERDLPEEAYKFLPIVIGIDVARYGEDRTVFTIRQGPKLHLQEVHRGLDTQQTGMRAAQFINEHNPDCIFVDDVGLGAGVTDYLRHTGFRDVIGVNGSTKPMDEQLYRNLRAECWGRMKDWLKTASIPDDEDLKRDLTVIEYAFDTKMRFILESKEDLRKRGEKSPDLADSLALSFASEVAVSEFYEEEESEYEVERGISEVTGY